MIVFDSHSTEYRNPSGAVPSGNELHLTARPESRRFPLRGYLRIQTRPGNGVFELQMEHIGLFQDQEYDEYSIVLDTRKLLETTGLLFYCFRFANDGGSFFYGCGEDGKSVFSETEPENWFQLTVYADEERPEWLGDSVVYQIFPDRFARGAEDVYPPVPENDDYRVYHTDMSDLPCWRPELFRGKMQVTNRDFFGGTLKGVISKLEYLCSLGVGVIYLNPVFQAFSNHRYDTADYLKIDPLLGDERGFSELCCTAHSMGIRVILDGVFNHTGSDSIYFNQFGTFSSVGAYQSKDSEFYSWYSFEKYPEKFLSWWDIPTLPSVNEIDAFLNFIAGDENSVVRRWLRAGADGWRLDVADELSDEFIQRIKSAILAEKPDAILIGEVWEDASNKVSYDKHRRYILGGGLDGVMNYPFRIAAMNYLKGGDGRSFKNDMSKIIENYPVSVLHNSLNLLGSHDTPRILSFLGKDDKFWNSTRSRDEGNTLEPDEYERAVRLLKIGVCLQYVFPGAPTIYYGDERGMQGVEDPMNRRWLREDADKRILDHYTVLGKLYREYTAFVRGEIKWGKCDGAILTLSRCTQSQQLTLICNRSGRWRIAPAGLDRFEGEIVDLITGAVVLSDEDGNIAVPPETAYIFSKDII